MIEVGRSAPEGPRSVELSALVGLLAGVGTDAGDAELIERIGALERVKAAAAAAQARMTAAFAVSQRDAQQTAGVPAERVGQGIAAQVALARRESPARAARYTGWATVLVNELPRTFAVLETGQTTEWRAMLVARETIWLSRADRATVDRELAGLLPSLGDRQVECEAKKLGYRLDPSGFLARSRAAESGRRVSLRPAPDTMTRLTALLPAAQGVAAYGALLRAADTARAAGEQRGRGQVMADTLVERVTGQSTAHDVPVNIDIVMTDRTLFGDSADATAGNDPGADSEPGDGDDGRDGADGDPGHGRGHGHGYPGHGYGYGYGEHNEPAHLLGYGPIPAGLARDLACSASAQVWVRRLYQDPTSRQLAAMDSRSRTFPAHIRHAITVRDQICRTPWCGAPIRHADHARSVARGGKTRLDNAQGLCEACNHAKQAPGWHTDPGPNVASPSGTTESVTIVTPTGHAYTSRPPDLPSATRDGVRPVPPPDLPSAPRHEMGPMPTAGQSPPVGPHPPVNDAQAA